MWWTFRKLRPISVCVCALLCRRCQSHWHHLKHRRQVPLLRCVSSLTTCNIMPDKEDSRVLTLETPDKSATDKKDYRAIQLGNGLRVLLISDRAYPLNKLDQEEQDEEEEEDEESMNDEEDEEDESDEEEMEIEDSCGVKKKSASGLKNSAAALCVGVGSFSDPSSLPGMAHFLEHMVFMGSEKYPDENAFDEFVSKCGGFDNAHTDCETTSFYFDIQRKHFKEALDRLAHFFVSPLMKQSAMQREREAVDSEFEQALTSDSNRMEQLFGTLAKPGHPMAKFMWGNLQSLQPKDVSEEDINKKLHEFRRRHYTAQSMTLCVQSQHELDDLQAWVSESFGSVPNNGLAKEEFSHLINPYDGDNFRKMYKIVPVKKVYRVDLNWALPCLMHKYECKPLHYLSWIIGHEGHGSLISYLRDKVWALSISAGNDGSGFQLNSTYSIFTITVYLTKEGYHNIDKVLKATFGYLNMLRSQPPNERIWSEIQKIERLDFDYGEEAQPDDNVADVAENMQLYPPKQYLTGDDLLFEFQPNLIKECVEELVPEKVNVMISAKEVGPQCDQSEEWFGTKYRVEDIPKEWVSNWQNAKPVESMSLPAKNDFITEDLSLKADNEASAMKFPSKIVGDDHGELYFRQDCAFKKPLAYINFLVVTPIAFRSIKDAVSLDIMLHCVKQVMVEETYPAELAQLSFSLSSSERGFVVKVSGFNHKCGLLLDAILDNIVGLSEKLTEQKFKAVRDQIKRNYYNHFIKPQKLVRDVRLSVLQDVFWDTTEAHSVVSDLDISDVLAMTKQIRGRGGYVHGLVQGNVTSDEAKAYYDSVKAKFQLSPITGPLPELRCRKIPLADKIIRVDGLNPKDGNTVVTNYYQETAGTLKNHAVLELLVEIMEEPVFDTLRTKEQLGYTVFSVFRNSFGVLGFSITICAQASKFTPQHLDGRIDAFLEWFLNEKLAKMPEDEFKEYVGTWVKAKLAADVTLQEEVSRNWSEICSCEYLFDRRFKDVENLESYVTKEKLVEALKSITSGGEHFRKLSVQVVGNGDAAARSEEEQGDEADDDEEVDHEMAKYFVKIRGAEKDEDESKFVKDLDKFRNSLEVYPILHIVD